MTVRETDSTLQIPEKNVLGKKSCSLLFHNAGHRIMDLNYKNTNSTLILMRKNLPNRERLSSISFNVDSCTEQGIGFNGLMATFPNFYYFMIICFSAVKLVKA